MSVGLPGRRLTNKQLREVSDALEQVLDERPLTYREMAAEVGLSASAICRYISCESPIPAEKAERFERMDPVRLHRSKVRPDLWPREIWREDLLPPA